MAVSFSPDYSAQVLVAFGPGATIMDVLKEIKMDEYEDFSHDELERDYDEPYEPDNWADADALASAGFGTDEDYGYAEDVY